MHLKFLSYFLVFALAAISGCAGSQSNKKLSYSQSAQANYEKGVAELEDENYLEANKYFHFVKDRFPFSRYSTLAELRIADAHFAQEKYTAAIDAYKVFLKFHPTHPQVIDGYVSFRICDSYVAQIPGDWFMVPPGHEKDQGATKQALAELGLFLKRFKKSKYKEKAQNLYRRVLRRLVDHELYVARFYLKRDKPDATILRLEGILARYPNAGADAEVMLLLGKTYLKQKKVNEAKETFSNIVKKYPEDPNAKKAKLFLSHLGSDR